MIDSETLQRIAQFQQTSVFPNIIREYVQHLFLTELYNLEKSELLLFKGGTALRIVYGSPRFSEDLDFSLFGVAEREVQSFVETLFIDVLERLERVNIHIEIDSKSARTTGGYLGKATLEISGYPSIDIEINVSTRNGRDIKGEVDSIANNFVPAYTLYHLSQAELVEEKVFGALLDRKMPRDYYDLYFIMRRGLLSADQKRKLAKVAGEIIKGAGGIDFQGELGALLPSGQQNIIRDFPNTLERELLSQLSSV